MPHIRIPTPPSCFPALLSYSSPVVDQSYLNYGFAFEVFDYICAIGGPCSGRDHGHHRDDTLLPCQSCHQSQSTSNTFWTHYYPPAHYLVDSCCTGYRHGSGVPGMDSLVDQMTLTIRRLTWAAANCRIFTGRFLDIECIDDMNNVCIANNLSIVYDS
jgi:hypothetical protein